MWYGSFIFLEMIIRSGESLLVRKLVIFIKSIEFIFFFFF